MITSVENDQHFSANQALCGASHGCANAKDDNCLGLQPGSLLVIQEIARAQTLRSNPQKTG
ncbi:MAG: hypothetical protein AB7V46_00420 [Thermomicrobiales bacterium]